MRKISITLVFCLITSFLFSQVQFTINTQQERKPISPYIYGTNQDREGVKNTARRFGGNRTTGYNWENNASNAGSDWYHHSDYYIPSDMGIPQSEWSIPGRCLTFFHQKSLQVGAASGITLQLAGYVSKDTNGTVSEQETAPSHRWCEVRFRKNAPFSYPPDLTDNYVYLDECVNFLINTFGQANTPNGIKVYMLDNEPDLWAHTHPRIHPNPTTCRELIWKSTTVASMVKDLDPYALIFGYASYGFKGYLDLQDAPDWNQVKGSNHRWFIDWYLEQMRIHSQAQGRRLLDALQVHWYPEAQGAGTRISFEDGSNTTRELLIARMQAPRTLWDPTYKSSQKGTITAGETSWINQWFPEYLPILPNLKQAIDQFYPGTKLAITEYSYGGEKNISGGIALADVLGIFAKYEVFWASMWGGDGPYTKAAFNIYLNYNGNGGKFGDTLVFAQTNNVERTSVYASIHGNDESKLHIIAINKDLDNNIQVTFNINSSYNYTYAEVWGFDSTSSNIIQRSPVTNITNNTFTYTLPKVSVLHFVLSGTQQTNLPPTKPSKPQGPQEVYIGPSYTFTTYSTDPNQDMIFYVFDWGDGSISTSSLLFSGATCYMTHIFTSSGTYSIRVKAIDSKGAESEWSEFFVVNVLNVVIEQLPKLTIYDGETSTTNFSYGGGWAAPAGSTIREVTENYNSPNHSLKLDITVSDYWGGAGYNWAGWWRQNMILDLTKFEQLECYLYISTIPPNARLTFHLKDSGNVMGREVVVNNYLPPDYLNKWVLVRIPLDEFFSIQVSTADRRRVWELQIGVTGVASGRALLYFDDFGFIYPQTPQQDNPPSINIISPSTNVVSGTVNIQVNATDDKGISKVLFFINEVCVSTDTTFPYSYTWNTLTYPDATYNIKVIAYDTIDQTSQSQITVMVRNQTQQQDNPPSVNITTPLNNSVVSSTITIRVMASDDRGISKVLFFINNICVSTDTVLPYEYIWNTLQVENGTYTIKVIAYDTSNQTAQSQVIVRVNNTLGDNPPKILEVLGIEEVISGEVIISLNIQDDRGIEAVYVYIDNNLFTILNTSPYTFTLNSYVLSDGTHTLTLVVYDTSNQTVQQTYQIFVNNTTQPVSFKKIYVFSPNNDGINDVIDFGDIEYVRIYDIKGKKIIETKRLDSTIKIEPGLYYYNLKQKDGTIKKGLINVVK